MKRILFLLLAVFALAMASNPQASMRFRNGKDTTWLTVSGAACTTAYYFADNRFHTWTAAWQITPNTSNDHMAATFCVEEVQDTLYPPGILDTVTVIPAMPAQWISTTAVNCGPFAFQPSPSRWIRFVIFYTFSSSAFKLGSFKVTTVESYWPPMAMNVNVTTSGVSGDSVVYATISHFAKTDIRGDSIHTIFDTLSALKSRVATDRSSIATCSTARNLDSINWRGQVKTCSTVAAIDRASIGPCSTVANVARASIGPCSTVANVARASIGPCSTVANVARTSLNTCSTAVTKKLPLDSQFVEVFSTTDTIIGGASEKMYFRGVTYCPSGGMRGDTNQLKALVRGIYTVQCDINDLVGDSTKPITAAYIATTGGDTLWGRVGANYITFAPTALIMAANDYVWVVATVGSAGQGWCLKTSRGKNFIWLKLKLDRAL